jgi:hypothetical protein
MIRTSSYLEDNNNNNNKRARIQNTNIFDDKNFSDIIFRENTDYIKREDLFNVMSEDIIKIYKMNTITNMKIGYIIYSNMDLASNKMNYILNNFVQNIDSEVHVSSVWEIEETVNNINKIKLKIIVSPNDKKMAIKKLSYELLKEKSNNNNKYNIYLKKYIK